ncbi:MMPL family transporter, partial [candidate division KSB1 bacterium]|nr:MMPL family transporter [candidate division KSB1 bacterium]
MRIPKLAIENYQFTIILMMALVLSGIFSFMNMPRTEDPPVSKSGASVIVLYPGATPADMEELVVDPLESALNELEDLNQINSEMEDGLVVIHVEFMIGTDPEEKYSDVVQKTNSVRNELPQDILSLDMVKWSVSDVNILQLAFVSESANYRTLEELSDDLKKDLEKVGGVRRVKTWAFPQQEVRVSIHPEKLAQMRIPLNQVIGAIRSANVNIPGGYVDVGAKRFNIHTSGNYNSVQDIRNTIVHTDGSKVVFLRDVADVDFDYEDRNYYARFNGKKAIFLTLNQKEGTNIFHIMEGIKPEIAEFKKTLPANITLESVFDQSVSVANRVNGFVSNLLQGIVLVGVVIFLSLSIRASIIVMLAIPFSILIGIGFVDLSGYGLQQMTIAGLVIALGILVDNAIVVVENISRFLKQGLPGKEAAVQGMDQIAWAIVSATITTVLAFIPIMMIGDITGDFIRSMPVTVVYTLLASLVVALTLTPYLSTKFLKAEKIQKENRFQRLLTYIIESPYRKTLAFALDHRKIMIGGALLILMGSLALFPFIGISFFPKAEKPQFIINIETPKGTSLDQTNQAALYVESIIRERVEIEQYATNIGRGNPRVYYNIVERRENSTVGQMFVQLKRYDHDEMDRLVSELRDEFSTYPDARIEVKELEQGPPVEA